MFIADTRTCSCSCPPHANFSRSLCPRIVLNLNLNPLFDMLVRARYTQGLKNLQEFSDAGASGAGEPTPEATMAKKKKAIKEMKSMKEREEKKKAKAAEKVN